MNCDYGSTGSHLLTADVAMADSTVPAADRAFRGAITVMVANRRELSHLFDCRVMVANRLLELLPSDRELLLVKCDRLDVFVTDGHQLHKCFDWHNDKAVQIDDGRSCSEALECY